MTATRRAVNVQYEISWKLVALYNPDTHYRHEGPYDDHTYCFDPWSCICQCFSLCSCLAFCIPLFGLLLPTDEDSLIHIQPYYSTTEFFTV